ncbi:hypothetical protein [Companilactobacillus futsaii]|uniref:Uncharacterized protein n=2 Tax=Companilactobacillus futsaii TaxID=938155 RepID=A0A5B7T1Z6_9LACO|nr:hypothetical protein [Companilactobacillus futsaii]KRK90534.1 hypothetical protein FC88_GL001791 [Companilactobacillus futsaii JCM 17355]QCX24600.1 hypothetical protein FG051_05525 [Companilactobacillus futsaii]
MIRRFNSNGIFSTQENIIDLYILNGNTFVKNGNTLGSHTAWKYQEYAYDESLKRKFFKVDNTEWACLEKQNQNIKVDFDNSDGNYTVIIDRDFDYLVPRTFTLYPVDSYHSDSETTQVYQTDGGRFITNGGIEMFDSTTSNGVTISSYNTGFRVDNTDYYSMKSVFPDSKLTYSSGSVYGENVTAINKIINVNSVAPDYFDLNGNAVTNIHYNLGHQILSDAVYTTNDRTGFKIGDNQFININDATGTPLMYGRYFPEQKGVN